MNNLPQDIGNLSAAEKFELINSLWQSIEADVPALTVEQRQELDEQPFNAGHSGIYVGGGAMVYAGANDTKIETVDYVSAAEGSATRYRDFKP